MRVCLVHVMYLIHKVQFNMMPVCKKCKGDVKRVYDCDHTNFEQYCVECYTELHYYMTEKGNPGDYADDNISNN